MQAVSPAPVFTKSFVPVDHVVSLTPKATLGVRLKVLGGPKVCVRKPHELSVSQCKVCEEGKEEGKGKETGKEKNGSLCIFVQTLCSKHEVLRVEAEILGNELLTVVSQKYGVAVERFCCTSRVDCWKSLSSCDKWGSSVIHVWLCRVVSLVDRLQVLIGFVHIATKEGVGLRGRRVTGVVNIVMCLL